MTDGDLYDLLQRLFGLGDWNEDSDLPWWKARQFEVTKIKRSRTARRVALEDLALAAEYAKAHGEDVRAVTWLYKLITPAIRWDNERSRAASLGQLDDEIAAAVEYEVEHHPDSPWTTRLSRARGAARKDVYQQWLQERGSRLSSPSARPVSGPRTATSVSTRAWGT